MGDSYDPYHLTAEATEAQRGPHLLQSWVAPPDCRLQPYFTDGGLREARTSFLVPGKGSVPLNHILPELPPNDLALGHQPFSLQPSRLAQALEASP